ncbi:fish-egg lectin-like [Synchiropus splendidus]|uniref:fish-egg lectin-like n=1 Tax=Synchiropus splendidus TaxID=270530 RepID=UPI00237D4489|nr:fish-egg lectin-like [Synchiropus splendidus]
MKTAIALLLLSCFLAASHALRCSRGPSLSQIKQIDAGHGFVVAVDRHDRPYMLSGNRWTSLGSVRLRHVSVGRAGIWGIGKTNKVYKLVGGQFLAARGVTMKMVAAGGDDFLLGIRASNSRSYCLISSRTQGFQGGTSLRWTSKSSKIAQASCGTNFCWGISSSGKPHVLSRITSRNCRSSRWERVSGALKMVKVGEDRSVFGLTANGQVHERIGITSGRPKGTRWRRQGVNTVIKTLAYDLGKVWLVSKAGVLMTCTR